MTTDSLTFDSIYSQIISPIPYELAEFKSEYSLQLSRIYSEFEAFHSFIRDTDYSEISQTPDGDFISFASLLAHRVTGQHNKDATILLEGKKGDGKSYTALDLSVGTSIEISRITGKPPENYFNFSHVNVLDPAAMEELFTSMVRYGVYIFDDAGTAVNAREFMSKNNIFLGKLMQTCRTNNNVIIFTAPKGGLMDKTFRELCRYRAEITNPIHSRGVTTLKIFLQSFNARLNKPYWHHLSKSHKKVKLWFSYGPRDPDMIKEYDRVRDENWRKLKESEAKQKENEKPPKRKKVAETANDEDGPEMVDLFLLQNFSVVEIEAHFRGKYGPHLIRQVLRMNGIDIKSRCKV